MVDAHKLAFHMRVTKMDAVIVLATAIAAVAVSVEFCILIGTFVSFLIYLPRAARVGVTELLLTPQGLIRERVAGDTQCDRLRIYSIEGELFFGSSTELRDELDKIEDSLNGARVVLLRLKYARNLDGVCLDVLEEFFNRLAARDVTVILCGVRQDMVKVLENVGLAERLGPQRLFPERAEVWSSTLQAVKRAYEILGDDRCPACPMPKGNGTPLKDWNYVI
jgi:SulP family sulfate permease